MAVAQLSWKTPDTSLFEPVDILALTQDHHEYHLTPSDPAEIANEYRKLAEKTNFISPYAAANSYEDFADTLATYYFLTRYYSYLIRIVYAEDLTVTASEEATKPYQFDTKQILESSKPHRDKVCKMVRLLLPAEDCEGKLKG